MVLVLSAGSILNAIYTFYRKRHYRLFEASVDTIPSTPSAHRVRVDSSPISSSPLRFLSSVIGAAISTETAQSRAHPDPQKDVWEIAVWDPLPLCLRLFCLFSPGHVLIYALFLPTTYTDPRPSTTIITSILVSLLLSLQLSLVQSSFSQQIKDSALIHKEVLHEYDTKYVHPRTQPLYRDVSTQFNQSASYNTTRDEKYNTVETSVPMHIVNRGFHPNPNPNYTKLIDPDAPAVAATPSRPTTLSHSASISSHTTPQTSTTNILSPLSANPRTAIRQPQFNRSTNSISDGGSLGVYSHAQSPLRKSTSAYFDPRRVAHSNNNASITAMEQQQQRLSHQTPDRRGHGNGRATSPLKRSSLPPSTGRDVGLSTLDAARRWGHLGTGDGGRRESGRF